MADGHMKALAIGATALAAGGVALGLGYAATRGRSGGPLAGLVAPPNTISCVVFLINGDDAPTGRVIRHPRRAPVADLVSAASAILGVDNPRLYLECTREELLADEESAAKLEAASAGAGRLVVLMATPARAPLGEAASRLPPLAPPPYGPRALPLVGNALCFTGPYEPAMYNLWHHVFKGGAYGDTVRLVLRSGMDPSIYGSDAPGGCDDASAVEETVFTSDPEIVGEMLARQDDFPKAWNRGPQKVLEQFASNGIFTSSTWDPDWAPIHGLLPRFYNILKIQGYYPAILDKTRVFMLEWARKAAGAPAEGALVEHVNDWFACMTADAVVKVSMGFDMHNIERKGAGDALHPLITAFREGIAACFGQADLRKELGAAYFCPFVSRAAANGRVIARARAEAEALIGGVVEKTRNGELSDPNSVIAAMLNEAAPNTGERVRLRAIYGHAINLLVAGHETTATTLAWTLFYLSRNPECEAKALKEIQEVLGDAAEPSAEHIPKLVYLEACFREALRLHPAVPNVARDAAADTILKSKWLVRRGQRVTVNLVAMHRREDVWGGAFGDPNGYNPERFAPGAAEKRHPNAFSPWGWGVRSCVGQLFALWEAKTFLCMLLPRFKLRTPPGYAPVPSNREGGATPMPYGLAFYVRGRPNAPATSQPTKPGAAPAAAAAAGIAAAAAGAGAAAAAAGPSHGTPLTVAYGSNSGMCEDFAQQAAAKARAAGFAATVVALDAAVAGGALPAAGALAVVTSTYNGNPPDNAAAFAKWLGGAPAANGVKFAVFGVGNSQWSATFQAFPKKVDAGLAKAGGAPLLPLSVVDVDKVGVTDAFEEWGGALVTALLSAFQVAAPAGSAGAAAAAAAAPPPRLALEPGGGGGAAPPDLVISEGPTIGREVMAAFRARLEAMGSQEGYHAMEVLASQDLLPPDSARRTRHVELSLPPGLDYTAGDHLEVLPTNSPALVQSALHALGLAGGERFVWTAGSKNDGAARGFGSASGGGARKEPGAALGGMRVDVPAAVALAYLADLSSPPPRKLVAALADACPCPPEAAKLRELAGEAGYAAGVAGPKLTLVELLLQFKSVKLSLSELLNALPRLAPRYYSISSSPLADPRRCSVTVGLVSFTSPTGRAHRGAASGLIHSQPCGKHLMGTVRCLQSSFKLPKNPATPIIMVGPGTGLAPMMGFMQEREMLLKAKRGPLGPALLFFGCRSADEDYIYRDRLEGYEASGVLTGLHVAFSRDGPSKVYVQDLIVQQGPEVWRLLEAGAHVFICGDARRMAPDVKKAFQAVAQAQGGRSEASAQNWMGALLEGGRYLEDVWAG